jgi:hypothetical protein
MEPDSAPPDETYLPGETSLTERMKIFLYSATFSLAYAAGRGMRVHRTETCIGNKHDHFQRLM